MNKLGLFKSMAIGLMLLAGTVSASAQKENIFGMANRVGVGVGVGTEGIGFDVAVLLPNMYRHVLDLTSFRKSISTHL